MLHPLFSTVIQRPDLLVDHLSAYSALFHQEAAAAASDVVKRGLAWVVAAASSLVFLLLTGVALMLGFLLNQFHWVLVTVPGAALVLTVLAIARAKMTVPAERFTELKSQIASDARALRTVS